MRLEGQTKMGYYPTPGVTLSLLPSWLSVPEAGPSARFASGHSLRRYLDPCCGKGEALAHIANGHADTYGIELSDVRAVEAEDKLGRVLNCAYEYAQLANETFSLVLLNPPYDGESAAGGKRMEETFLVDRGTTDLLVPGGILIYIIPHSRINETIARHLAGWYTDLRCFKLPAGEYDVFKQVIIFGARREDYSTPKGETLSDVLAWKNGQRFAGYEEAQVVVEENAASDFTDDNFLLVIEDGVYDAVIDDTQPIEFLAEAFDLSRARVSGKAPDSLRQPLGEWTRKAGQLFFDARVEE